jgi:hypothetical protein
MSHGVRRHALGDAGGSGGLGADAAEVTRRERVDAILTRKQITLRPQHQPPVPQQFEQMRGQHRVAVHASLALLDPDQRALAVNVRDLKRDDLRYPQTSAVGYRQCSLVFGVRAASNRRAISSGLRISGSFRGCGTSGIWLAMSNRQRVTRKKNRSAAIVALMVHGETPRETK